MEFSIVEKLGRPQEIIFSLFRSHQLDSCKIYLKMSNFITFPNSSYFPTLGQWLLGTCLAVP